MLKHVAVNDTQLAVYDAGRGHTLLFVHGFPLSHRMWLAQLETFAAGYRVIAPDLRGFGSSAVSEGCVTMEQFADDCAAVLDALGITEPVTFVGLSMGGYIGWQFARKHTARLARLVICDSRAAPDMPEAAALRLKMADHVLRAGTEGVAAAMLPKLFAPTTHERLPRVVEAVREMILASPPAGVAAAQHGMAQRPDARPLLPTIRTPTLIICGAHDLISPPDEMRAIAAAISAAQYVELPDAGHMSPMESPIEFDAALMRFL